MGEPTEIENWKRILILGSGAFGIVTLWQDTDADQYVAIKKCKFQRDVSVTEKQKKRWISEVEMMKNLKHENIVGYKPIPDHFHKALINNNPTQLPLLTMEYCKLGNLRRQLNQVRNSCGLRELEVRTLLEDISKGIHHLHRFNITHRDIKPDNIVLQQCDTRKIGIIYKIIDLGYAKELNDSVISFVGTLHYLAPEIMKTEIYNSCVDYWSLGIVTFEVICGILPFLPQLDPFQRFKYIQSKEKDHICINYIHSGRMVYSSQLLKENHISSCLQQHIEIWLRHVLQFDPNLRSAKFPDSTNVFENLQNILKKQIITVFSIYTLEFYSYEINDSTLVSTLKSWIARDIKVAIEEQIMLTNRTVNQAGDNLLIKDIISQDDANIFIFKKRQFMNDIKATLPKCIRILFEKCTEQFEWKELRQIYCKTLFYLCEDVKLLEYLSMAFQLYLKYAQQSTVQLKKLLHEIHQFSSKILTKTECYYNIRSSIAEINIDSENSLKYQKCLENFQNLMKRLEESTVNVNKLIKKVHLLQKRQEILNKLYPKMVEIFRNCDINKRVKDAMVLIEKGPADRAAVTPKEMGQIINLELKCKDQILHNKDFQNYFLAACTAAYDNEIMLNWMNNFHKDLLQLSKAIDDNEVLQYNILISSKPTKLFPDNDVTITKSSLGIHVNFDTDILIKENQKLRYRVEDVLSQFFLLHKKISEDLENIVTLEF